MMFLKSLSHACKLCPKSIIPPIMNSTKFNWFRFFCNSRTNYRLNEGNLIFCCRGLTDPNFWQIKTIIILISHTNFSVFLQFIFLLIYFFRGYRKATKGCNGLTRWSVFLFLDMPTLKLRIIIIILATDRPNIILPIAHTTKN